MARPEEERPERLCRCCRCRRDRRRTSWATVRRIGGWLAGSAGPVLAVAAAVRRFFDG